ncbi:CLCA_X family protein [Shewanella sp. A14]
MASHHSLLNHQRHFERIGPNYRNGESVSFLDIKHTFGLQHIRVGKWVNREESALAANLIFDSLADLANILGVPPTLLGLRGSLRFAFGHGGQKGVQAHYSPAFRELALAKNAGAGALAHEFWHAFDHYIADKMFIDDSLLSPDGYMSTSNRYACATDHWLGDKTLIAHPLNQQLSTLFNITFLTANGQEPHDYVSRSIALDKQQKCHYFAKPTEMMARAFEASIEMYSQDIANISNPYLVNSTINSALAQHGAYPDAQHCREIYQAMLAYFEPLGLAFDKQQGGE